MCLCGLRDDDEESCLRAVSDGPVLVLPEDVRGPAGRFGLLLDLLVRKLRALRRVSEGSRGVLLFLMLCIILEYLLTRR